MFSAGIERLRKSEYKKGFFLIFSSKVFIMGVTFVTTPILSRIYSPAEYGYFGLLVSITTIIVIVSNLTLPQCLLTIEESNVQSTTCSIFDLSFLITILFFVIGLSLSLFGILHLDIISLALIVVASIMTTVTQVFANLNIRDRAFKKNVKVNIVESVVVRLLSLCLGILDFTKFGLFFSDIMGKFVNSGHQLRTSGERNFRLYYGIRVFDWVRIRGTIAANKNYPLFNLPSTLISSFFNQLLLWILALSFSTTSVGYFTMSVGLLNVPLQLFANSLQPLVTSRLVTGHRELSYLIFIRLASIVLVISAIIYSSIYFISPYFIKVYLGGAWLECISFVQILCVPFGLQLLGSSLQGAILVFNKHRSYFVIKLIFLTVLIVSLGMGFNFGFELKFFIILYSVILSLEEVVKISYLIIRIKHVRGS